MRINKSGIIVSIILTIILLAVGVLFVLPEPKSPLAVTEVLTLSQSKPNSPAYIEGKVKNESENSVTISQMDFFISSNKGTYQIVVDEYITLQPQEEYSIDVESENVPATVKSLTKFTVVVDGKEYNIITNSNSDMLLGIAMFVLAAIFAAAVLGNILAMKKLKKRLNGITQSLSQLNCNAQYYTGINAASGQTRKSQTQFFEVISILMYGFSSRHGAHSALDFVVTDDGLYIGKPNKNGLELSNMSFVDKTNFRDYSIMEQNDCVTLQSNVAGNKFTIYTQNSGTTAKQLLERFNEFKKSEKVEEPLGESAVSNEVKSENSDPFAD